MSATSLRSQQAASKKEFESFVEDLHVALARPTATHGGRVSVCVCVQCRLQYSTLRLGGMMVVIMMKLTVLMLMLMVLVVMMVVMMMPLMVMLAMATHDAPQK